MEFEGDTVKRLTVVAFLLLAAGTLHAQNVKIGTGVVIGGSLGGCPTSSACTWTQQQTFSPSGTAVVPLIVNLPSGSVVHAIDITIGGSTSLFSFDYLGNFIAAGGVYANFFGTNASGPFTPQGYQSTCAASPPGGSPVQGYECWPNSDGSILYGLSGGSWGHILNSYNGAGTCTMAAGTSCASTITWGTRCTATVQGTTPIASACSISGTTLTVTAASSNSDTWAWVVF